MIFDENSMCTAVKCEDLHEENIPIRLNEGALCAALVSSGRAAVTCGDEAAVLPAGGIALMCEGEISPEADSHVLCICLDGSTAREAAEAVKSHGGLIVTDGSACPMAAQLMYEAASAFNEGGARLAPLCFSLLCELSSADRSKPAMSPLVADAVAAMRKNYAGLYGVEELSTQLGVSKSHLVRTFSAEMGVSPGKYLTGVRITEARRLLSHREYSLEVIATLCGFSGANYLCKVFKKEVGLSPAVYREKYRASAEMPRRSEAEDILFV